MSEFVADKFFKDTDKPAPSPWANAMDYNDMMYSGVTDDVKTHELKNAFRYDKIFNWDSTTPILSSLFELFVTPKAPTASVPVPTASVPVPVSTVIAPVLSSVAAAVSGVATAVTDVAKAAMSTLTGTATAGDISDDMGDADFAASLDGLSGELPEPRDVKKDVPPKKNTYYPSSLVPIHNTFQSMLYARKRKTSSRRRRHRR